MWKRSSITSPEWALEHRCAVGKVHYIEVFSNDEEEEEEEPEGGHSAGIA